MVSIEDNIITITRGDTLETEIRIEQESGKDFLPSEGDKIRFALKSAYSDIEPIIVKDISTEDMILHLDAVDTKKLPARRKPYVYDVQLTTPDGWVSTVIACGQFYVTEEVH